MARKAAHDQRAVPTDWVCDHCKQDTCSGCIDIMRAKVLRAEPMCSCRRRDHNFETTVRPKVEVPNGADADGGG